MDIILGTLVESSSASASTSDWIGHGGAGGIYAYDIGGLDSQCAGSTGVIKNDDLEKTSGKSNLPIGEHIREAIQIIRGRTD